MPLELISPTTILQMESEPLGKVFIEGQKCRLRIGPDVELNANIRISPEVDGASIEIGRGCKLGGIFRIVRGKGGSIRIGENTTFNQVGISMHEAGQVVIGRDCMFSIDIHLDPSDMHPIFDRATGERINPPQDIRIGDHVWLGTRVLVMKGARIGSGSIIGAGSIVVGEIPENVLAVGVPARVVRENVVWARDMDQKPELVPGSGRRPKKGWFR